MKNKIKKYAAIGTIAIMGLLLANTAVEKTVTLISDTDTSCIGVYSGGEKTVGRNDADYKGMEKYCTDEEIYRCIEDAYFSTPVIEQILNDGRCLAYVDQLKAEGWIPQDFTPAGSKPSSTAQTETKAEPTQEEIDAAWEETERTEATCTADGKIVYTNSITGDTKEESLPATGHDYEITETADATCTEDGANTYTCKVCGDTYEEAIPAAGHAEGEWTVTQKAGLFSAGEKTLACEKCGEVLKTESIQQKCPLSLTAVIGIAVCIILVVAIVIMAVAKRRKRQ